MRKVRLFLFAAILLIAACKDQNREIVIHEKAEGFLSNSSGSDIQYEMAPLATDNSEVANSYTWNVSLNNADLSADIIPHQEKIIKEGNISIESKDLQKSKENIEILIQNHHAFKDNETFSNNIGSASYDLKIRIPSENFEKFVSDLEIGTDEIIHKNIFTKDATAEYIDIATRLNNKRAYLQRYQELLAKANKVEDILAIQEEARGLQEEIESSEARLKTIDNKATYSTLDIKLFSEKVLQSNLKEVSFFEKIKDSLGSGWDTLVGFVLWIISVWPGIIMLLFALIILLRVRRRKRIKRQVS
jgi:hypothetical protein